MTRLKLFSDYIFAISIDDSKDIDENAGLIDIEGGKMYVKMPTNSFTDKDIFKYSLILNTFVEKSVSDNDLRNTLNVGGIQSFIYNIISEAYITNQAIVDVKFDQFNNFIDRILSKCLFSINNREFVYTELDERFNKNQIEAIKFNILFLLAHSFYFSPTTLNVENKKIGVFLNSPETYMASLSIGDFKNLENKLLEIISSINSQIQE